MSYKIIISDKNKAVGTSMLRVKARFPSAKGMRMNLKMEI